MLLISLLPLLYALSWPRPRLWRQKGGLEARVAIFTRSEVVDFILDLAGYTEDQPLHEKRLLEPSFGGGDFLL